MSSERPPTPADPLYLALGRFVVEFSQFVGHMQAGLISVAGIGRGMDVVTALQIATAELGADQLRKVFFATCSALADLSGDEAKIRDKLSARAGKLIEKRNAIQHGEWFSSSTTGGEETRWDAPLALYERISHKEDRGLASRHVQLTIPELEALADEANEMRRLVWLFATGCSSHGPSVAERLEIKDDQVVARDPTPVD